MKYFKLGTLEVGTWESWDSWPSPIYPRLRSLQGFLYVHNVHTLRTVVRSSSSHEKKVEDSVLHPTFFECRSGG